MGIREDIAPSGMIGAGSSPGLVDRMGCELRNRPELIEPTLTAWSSTPNRQVKSRIGSTLHNVTLTNKYFGQQLGKFINISLTYYRPTTMKVQFDPLSTIPGIGVDVRECLYASGYESVYDLREASEQELRQVPGIGEKKSRFLEEYLSE